jgi:hypothetical protein
MFLSKTPYRGARQKQHDSQKTNFNARGDMMSINSLTETEVRRSVLGGGAADPNAPPPPAGRPSTSVNNALSMLVKYIPTESVTLYVAAISAAAALKSVWSGITTVHIYWFFAGLTPVIFILVLIGKRRTMRLAPVPPPREFPWWKVFACTVAFIVWALAVPGNPYISGDTAGAVVGFLAIFISTILSLLEPIFDRPDSA